MAGGSVAIDGQWLVANLTIKDLEAPKLEDWQQGRLEKNPSVDLLERAQRGAHRCVPGECSPEGGNPADTWPAQGTSVTLSTIPRHSQLAHEQSGKVSINWQHTTFFMWIWPPPRQRPRVPGAGTDASPAPGHS